MSDWRDQDIYRAIIEAPAERPFVVAQLGQSLDGRIATPTGESRWINGKAALEHVHKVRAVVDGVLVGVGTAIADDPLLNVRHVATDRQPARIVIDLKARLPIAAKCMGNGDGARRLIVRAGDGPAAEGAEICRIEVRDGHGCPREIVAKLFQMGVRRILVEGGATTVSAFLDADAVDRLHILVAPVILGSGKTGLSLKPIERLVEAKRPATRVHVLATGDVLFDCDMRQRVEPS